MSKREVVLGRSNVESRRNFGADRFVRPHSAPLRCDWLARSVGAHVFFTRLGTSALHTKRFSPAGNRSQVGVAPAAPAGPSLTAQARANRHAHGKHVVKQSEFPGTKNPTEFAAKIDRVITNHTHTRTLSGGRTAYRDNQTGGHPQPEGRRPGHRFQTHRWKDLLRSPPVSQTNGSAEGNPTGYRTATHRRGTHDAEQRTQRGLSRPGPG